MQLSFTVHVGGKRRYIRFNLHSRGGSYYVTSDEAEQEAIERHPFFTGGSIFVENVAEPEAPAPEEKPREVVKVKNCPAARAWIEEHLSLTLPQVVSKAKLREIGLENGIEFEFEK